MPSTQHLASIVVPVDAANTADSSSIELHDSHPEPSTYLDEQGSSPTIAWMHDAPLKFLCKAGASKRVIAGREKKLTATKIISALLAFSSASAHNYCKAHSNSDSVCSGFRRGLLIPQCSNLPRSHFPFYLRKPPYSLLLARIHRCWFKADLSAGGARTSQPQKLADCERVRSPSQRRYTHI
jgi:hypothetical protein